jgi:hypothetical protein
LENGVHIFVAQVECDPEFLQHFVVGKKIERFRDRAVWPETAFFNDQAIEKPAEYGIREFCKTIFTFAFQPVFHLGGMCFPSRFRNHFCHLSIVDVQGVAQAAQSIIVGHENGCAGLLRFRITVREGGNRCGV